MAQQLAITGAEAGLNGDAQIRIALQAIDANGGIAPISMLYSTVEQQMNGAKLSEQGKASLRYFVNRVAVQAGYLYPADPSVPGWRITPEGRAFLGVEQAPSEEAINERGLDLIGSLVGNASNQPQVVGVQVKFHSQNAAPSQLEWFRFLAGCFARQVDRAIFVTSGRLTSEQRREAGEARVIVIEGRDEITRIGDRQHTPKFDLFDEQPV